MGVELPKAIVDSVEDSPDKNSYQTSGLYDLYTFHYKELGEWLHEISNKSGITFDDLCHMQNSGDKLIGSRNDVSWLQECLTESWSGIVEDQVRP